MWKSSIDTYLSQTKMLNIILFSSMVFITNGKYLDFFFKGIVYHFLCILKIIITGSIFQCNCVRLRYNTNQGKHQRLSNILLCLILVWAWSYTIFMAMTAEKLQDASSEPGIRTLSFQQIAANVSSSKKTFLQWGLFLGAVWSIACLSFAYLWQIWCQVAQVSLNSKPNATV